MNTVSTSADQAAQPLGGGSSEGLGPDAPTVGWYQGGRLTVQQPPGVSYGVCIRIEAERALTRAVAAERERWKAHADAMAQTLEAFEAQGSDKTAALRAYLDFRA